MKFANGQRFFPRGYHLSEAFTGTAPHWRALMDQFFGGKKEFNLCTTTFWQGRLLAKKHWDNLPYNGFYPIVPGDYTRLDIAAWKHVDVVLRELESHGAIWFNFDGFVPNVGGDMGSTRTNFDAQRIYVRNVVARLAPYWNVVWNIAFAWQEFMSASDVARIADLVRSLDPWHHLITVHDQGSFHTGAEVRAALHVDFPTLQYDAGKVPNAITAYQLVRQFAGDWPVFAQEVTWEGTTKLNADQIRHGAWGVALAGGMVNYAEMFDGPNQGKPANYGDGGAFPYLAIVFEFVESLGESGLQPHPELVQPGQLCLARPGIEYACYAPDGGEIRVNLAAASGGYAVQWLNPRTGQRLAGEKVQVGAAQRFKAPFAGEAVLHLKTQ